MPTVGTDENKEVDKAKTSELGINIKDLLNAKKMLKKLKTLTKKLNIKTTQDK